MLWNCILGKLVAKFCTFRIQKKAIRIVKWCGNRVLCRNLFKKLQILPLKSQCMLPSLMFVVQNKNRFSTNIENHNTGTRQRNNLYLPQANLTIYQKGAYYLGIKLLIIYPWRLRMLLVIKKSLKLLWKNFYTLIHFNEKYFSQSWIMYCITKFLIILVLVLRFYLCTLYKYSLIVYYELITFLWINLMCLIYVLYS